MKAADGKMRNTDCADTETMLRIVQSIPSPQAEPFKQWLAQVGTERLAEADNPEAAFEEWRRRAIASYMASGYPEEWAEKRVELIVTRNQLAHEWMVRGITSEDIPILTDRLHMGTFGINIEDHKALKEYPLTKDGKRIGNLSDGLVLTEVAFSSLSSALAVEQHQRNDSHGREEIERDVDFAAKVARAARETVEQLTGHPVVSAINAMPRANTLWGADLPAIPDPKSDH